MHRIDLFTYYAPYASYRHSQETHQNEFAYRIACSISNSEKKTAIRGKFGGKTYLHRENVVLTFDQNFSRDIEFGFCCRFQVNLEKSIFPILFV